MRHRGATVIIALGTLVSACSALVDFKYLSGADADADGGPAVGNDASSALDGAGSTDAGGTGLEDGSTAGMNTTDGADAGGPYCASLAGAASLVFCADFDQSMDERAGWSGADIASSACTLALTTMGPVSAPRALGAITTAPSTDCALYYHHAAVGGSVRVEAEVHLSDFPTKGSQIFPLALYQTPSYRSAVLAVSAGGWTALDIPSGGMATVLNASAAGSSSSVTWHHVSMTVSFTMAQTLLTAYVDGVQVVKDVMLSSGFTPGDDWEIYVGLAQNNLATKDAIDNVAIYMK